MTLRSRKGLCGTWKIWLLLQREGFFERPRLEICTLDASTAIMKPNGTDPKETTPRHRCAVTSPGLPDRCKILATNPS